MTISPSPAIVLVDDEPAALGILQRQVCILAPGYNVIAVTDGAAALIQIARQPVALVIADYQMPRMSGLTLITAIKIVAPQCSIVLISGYLSPALMQDGHRAGANFYLPKPYLFSQLAAVVQQALARAAMVGGVALHG